MNRTRWRRWVCVPTPCYATSWQPSGPTRDTPEDAFEPPPKGTSLYSTYSTFLNFFPSRGGSANTDVFSQSAGRASLLPAISQAF